MSVYTKRDLAGAESPQLPQMLLLLHSDQNAALAANMGLVSADGFLWDEKLLWAATQTDPSDSFLEEQPMSCCSPGY